MENTIFSIPYKPSHKIAGFLALVLFFQGGVFAYSTETNFWKERSQAAQATRTAGEKAQTTLLASLPQNDKRMVLPFSQKALGDLGVSQSLSRHQKRLLTQNRIPAWIQESIAPYATIQAFSTPPSSVDHPKTVLLVQDIHLHQEAHANIEGMVHRLGLASAKRSSSLLIGLEGADAASVDLTPYSQIKDRWIVKGVADALLKAKVLNGVEAAVIGYAEKGKEGAVQLPYEVIGVENQADFAEDVKALKDGIAIRPKAEKFIAEYKKNLDGLKSKIDSKGFHQLESKLAAYEEGKISLPDYVVFLDSIVPVATPELRKVISAALIEGTLNFSKVESERTRVLEQLVAKMKEGQVNELVQMSALFRAGEVAAGDYYGHLRTVCQNHGIDFAKFPEMNLYIQYVIKSESIDSAALMPEIAKHEMLAIAAVSKTEQEKEIFASIKDYYLAKKLVDLSLTEDEWKSFKLDGSPLLASYKEFYKVATGRNQTMASKMADRLLASKSDTALLLAGGFHTQGLVEELKKRNLTILTLSPKITQVGEGLSSVEVLASGRLPLDRLFAGERLFIPVPPEIAAPRLADTVQATVSAISNLAAGQTDTTVRVGDIEASAERATSGASSKPGTISVEFKEPIAFRANVTLSAPRTSPTAAQVGVPAGVEHFLFDEVLELIYGRPEQRARLLRGIAITLASKLGVPSAHQDSMPTFVAAARERASNRRAGEPRAARWIEWLHDRSPDGWTSVMLTRALIPLLNSVDPTHRTVLLKELVQLSRSPNNEAKSWRNQKGAPSLEEVLEKEAKQGGVPEFNLNISKPLRNRALDFIADMFQFPKDTDMNRRFEILIEDGLNDPGRFYENIMWSAMNLGDGILNVKGNKTLADDLARLLRLPRNQNLRFMIVEEGALNGNPMLRYFHEGAPLIVIDRAMWLATIGHQKFVINRGARRMFMERFLHELGHKNEVTKGSPEQIYEGELKEELWVLKNIDLKILETLGDGGFIKEHLDKVKDLFTPADYRNFSGKWKYAEFKRIKEMLDADPATRDQGPARDAALEVELTKVAKMVVGEGPSDQAPNARSWGAPPQSAAQRFNEWRKTRTDEILVSFDAKNPPLRLSHYEAVRDLDAALIKIEGSVSESYRLVVNTQKTDWVKYVAHVLDKQKNEMGKVSLVGKSDTIEETLGEALRDEAAGWLFYDQKKNSFVLDPAASSLRKVEVERRANKLKSFLVKVAKGAEKRGTPHEKVFSVAHPSGGPTFISLTAEEALRFYSEGLISPKNIPPLQFDSKDKYGKTISNLADWEYILPDDEDFRKIKFEFNLASMSVDEFKTFLQKNKADTSGVLSDMSQRGGTRSVIGKYRATDSTEFELKDIPVKSLLRDLSSGVLILRDRKGGGFAEITPLKMTTGEYDLYRRRKDKIEFMGSELKGQSGNVAVLTSDKKTVQVPGKEAVGLLEASLLKFEEKDLAKPGIDIVLKSDLIETELNSKRVIKQQRDLAGVKPEEKLKVGGVEITRAELIKDFDEELIAFDAKGVPSLRASVAPAQYATRVAARRERIKFESTLGQSSVIVNQKAGGPVRSASGSEARMAYADKKIIFDTATKKVFLAEGLTMPEFEGYLKSAQALQQFKARIEAMDTENRSREWNNKLSLTIFVGYQTSVSLTGGSYSISSKEALAGVEEGRLAYNPKEERNPLTAINSPENYKAHISQRRKTVAAPSSIARVAMGIMAMLLFGTLGANAQGTNVFRSMENVSEFNTDVALHRLMYVGIFVVFMGLVRLVLYVMEHYVSPRTKTRDVVDSVLARLVSEFPFSEFRNYRTEVTLGNLDHEGELVHLYYLRAGDGPEENSEPEALGQGEITRTGVREISDYYLKYYGRALSQKEAIGLLTLHLAIGNFIENNYHPGARLARKFGIFSDGKFNEAPTDQDAKPIMNINEAVDRVTAFIKTEDPPRISKITEFRAHARARNVGGRRAAFLSTLSFFGLMATLSAQGASGGIMGIVAQASSTLNPVMVGMAVVIFILAVSVYAILYRMSTTKKIREQEIVEINQKTESAMARALSIFPVGSFSWELPQAPEGFKRPNDPVAVYDHFNRDSLQTIILTFKGKPSISVKVSLDEVESVKNILNHEGIYSAPGRDQYFELAMVNAVAMHVLWSYEVGHMFTDALGLSPYKKAFESRDRGEDAPVSIEDIESRVLSVLGINESYNRRADMVNAPGKGITLEATNDMIWNKKAFAYLNAIFQARAGDNKIKKNTEPREKFRQAHELATPIGKVLANNLPNPNKRAVLHYGRVTFENGVTPNSVNQIQRMISTDQELAPLEKLSKASVDESNTWLMPQHTDTIFPDAKALKRPELILLDQTSFGNDLGLAVRTIRDAVKAAQEGKPVQIGVLMAQSDFEKLIAGNDGAELQNALPLMKFLKEAPMDFNAGNDLVDVSPALRDIVAQLSPEIGANIAQVMVLSQRRLVMSPQENLARFIVNIIQVFPVEVDGPTGLIKTYLYAMKQA